MWLALDQNPNCKGFGNHLPMLRREAIAAA